MFLGGFATQKHTKMHFSLFSPWEKGAGGMRVSASEFASEAAEKNFPT
jgi:hypothetical protein